ncbi:MAG: adenosylcobinamide amidohydrolase, partial [Halorhabdus sp.]
DYVERRFARAGFEPDGPVLLTGVAQRHARGARAGPVTAFATVGLSNPATLPVEPADDGPPRADRPARSGNPDRPPAGTVNVVVLTSRALTEAGAANLLAVASEARTATLLALTGFTGTTSDAAVIGYDPDGELARYTGSATTVGRAARACVRDAIRASFAARYDDREPPDSVATAAHGAATTECAEVFEP